MGIMPALWMKKLRPREAPHSEIGARPSSSTAPLPSSPRCNLWGGTWGRPQGPWAGVFLPESCGLLPACMPPNGGPVAGPRSMASLAEQLSVAGKGGPAHRADRLGPHVYLMMSIIPVLSPERSLSS